MTLLVGPLHLFAVLLVVSGADKLGDPAAATKAMTEAGLPGSRRLGPWAGRALGLAEVAVGAVVLAFGGVGPAIAMAAVFLGFGAFLVLLQRRAAGVGCGCFGASTAPPGISHLLIDVAAAGTAIAAAATTAPDLTAVLDEGAASFTAHLVLVVVAAGLLIAVSSVLEDVKNQREALRGMSLTTTLTDRATRYVGRKTSRRGFLARSALVGSAIAVAGKEFVLEPRSAYAATCGCNGRTCDCGSLCCDGYTEFCCQIYGQNSCPPGTLLAGWWKVDGSNYCNGAARYYMDCNDSCGGCGCGSNGLCSGSCSGANCGCRSCGNRKDGCTHFRYGNCNNQVRCVGPIMCRVVTCTKPWEIEPTCTTATRVDNNTRFHHRPCLEEPAEPGGSISSVSTSPGGLRISGSVTGDVTSSARIEVFVDRQPIQTFLVGTGSFDVSITNGPGNHEVCVYLDPGGSGDPVKLGCRNVVRDRVTSA